MSAFGCTISTINKAHPIRPCFVEPCGPIWDPLGRTADYAREKTIKKVTVCNDCHIGGDNWIGPAQTLSISGRWSIRSGVRVAKKGGLPGALKKTHYWHVKAHQQQQL